MSTQAGVDRKLAASDHTVTLPSPIAVGLRVPNVRQAAAVYQQIGFTFVMAVPDEHGDWILCLLRYDSDLILLGALDHPKFPRASSPRSEGIDP